MLERATVIYGRLLSLFFASFALRERPASFPARIVSLYPGIKEMRLIVKAKRKGKGKKKKKPFFELFSLKTVYACFRSKRKFC